MWQMIYAFAIIILVLATLYLFFDLCDHNRYNLPENRQRRAREARLNESMWTDFEDNQEFKL